MGLVTGIGARVTELYGAINLYIWIWGIEIGEWGYSIVIPNGAKRNEESGNGKIYRKSYFSDVGRIPTYKYTKFQPQKQ